MGLFSRRKKPAEPPRKQDTYPFTFTALAAVDPFLALEARSPASATDPPAPDMPPLPFALPEPPPAVEVVPGMPDNVLLVAALQQLEHEPTPADMLGILRQSLQGNLFVRMKGDHLMQRMAGEPYELAYIDDGKHLFSTAYSSAAAVRDALLAWGSDPADNYVAQMPVRDVYRYVSAGPFAGLVLDDSSTPIPVTVPTGYIDEALDDSDLSFALKSLIAAPRDEHSEARVADALPSSWLWVAVRDENGSGDFVLADVAMPDGNHYLLLFSHPFEVLSVPWEMRQDHFTIAKPMQFSFEQAREVLQQNPRMTGVLVDPAGPMIAIRREVLDAVAARKAAW